MRTAIRLVIAAAVMASLMAVAAEPSSAAGNTAPVAVDDALTVHTYGTLSLPPDRGVLANDTDPDGDPLTAAVVTPPAWTSGTLTLLADGTTYFTAKPAWSGTTTFTYRVSDGTATSELATVTLTVAPLAPDGLVGAPTGIAATGGNHEALVRWTAPDTAGTAPVTGYLISSQTYVLAVTDGSARSVLVTGLPNGGGLQLSVAAVTAQGRGPWSLPNEPITLTSFEYHPYTSWGELVDNVTRDLSPGWLTPARRTTWVAALSGGSKTKGDLVEEVRTSADHTSAVDPVARLYRAALGRTPDASGLEFWVGRKRAGTWSVMRMADHFAASSEFTNRYGPLSNRAFVTRLYTDVLGRAADPSGVDYWTGKLDRRERNRGGVLLGFSESTEYQRKQAANTDVAVAYVFLLGRAPRADEVDAWTQGRQDGTTAAALTTELLSSMTYYVAVKP